MTAGASVPLSASGTECAGGCARYAWTTDCESGASVQREGADASVTTGTYSGDIELPKLTATNCRSGAKAPAAQPAIAWCACCGAANSSPHSRQRVGAGQPSLP